MNAKFLIRVLFLIFIGMVNAIATPPEQDVEYRPGGRQFAKSWNSFYKGGHEPEMPSPLVKAGRRMVPSICDAVRHPNMRLRRYAISALGLIKDKYAIPTLEKILNNVEEVDYFRGDALEAIYQIDHELGTKLSDKFVNEINYLKYSVNKIKKMNSAMHYKKN